MLPDADMTLNAFEHCTADSVKQGIASAPSKPCALDLLPTTFMKECLPERLPYLIDLRNSSLTENVNRYSKQILLVSGLWIYGTLCLRRLCLLKLWIVWRTDLIGTVSTSDTVITGKISSFNDQSTGLSGLSWTALLLLILLLVTLTIFLIGKLWLFTLFQLNQDDERGLQTEVPMSSMFVPSCASWWHNGTDRSQIHCTWSSCWSLAQSRRQMIQTLHSCDDQSFLA